MALSAEEIRERLAGFVESWRDYSGSERSEAQTFLNDKVFVTFPELHRQQVQREHEAAILQQRAAAVSVGLYAVERPLHAFEPALR